ncbi:MAG: RNA 2'-phosphotransferase [Bacteroidia bacterium]
MNTNSRFKRLSKFLSLVLRHKPETIGLQLGEQGWVDFSVLLEKLGQTDLDTSREELLAMIADNDKQRFSYDAASDRIRAAQGHSVQVELGYSPQEPPERLFHGTVGRFLDSIAAQGLLPGSRHQVHLSPDVETATRVGDRRGKAVILNIDAAAMHSEGFAFFRSDNGVWLCDHVPPRYIDFPKKLIE